MDGQADVVTRLDGVVIIGIVCIVLRLATLLDRNGTTQEHAGFVTTHTFDIFELFVVEEHERFRSRHRKVREGARSIRLASNQYRRAAVYDEVELIEEATFRAKTRRNMAIAIVGTAGKALFKSRRGTQGNLHNTERIDRGNLGHRIQPLLVGFRERVRNSPVLVLRHNLSGAGIRLRHKALDRGVHTPVNDEAVEHVLGAQLLFEEDIDFICKAVTLEVTHFGKPDRNRLRRLGNNHFRTGRRRVNRVHAHIHHVNAGLDRSLAAYRNIGAVIVTRHHELPALAIRSRGRLANDSQRSARGHSGNVQRPRRKGRHFNRLGKGDHHRILFRLVSGVLEDSHTQKLRSDTIGNLDLFLRCRSIIHKEHHGITARASCRSNAKAIGQRHRHFGKSRHGLRHRNQCGILHPIHMDLHLGE